MGGTKNRSPAQRERAQQSRQADSKKSKTESGPPKASITVTLTEKQASRALKGAKVITMHDLARQTGVKVSAANLFLRDEVKKGTIRVAGGYSGHYIYQPVNQA